MSESRKFPTICRKEWLSPRPFIDLPVISSTFHRGSHNNFKKLSQKSFILWKFKTNFETFFWTEVKKLFFIEKLSVHLSIQKIFHNFHKLFPILADRLCRTSNRTWWFDRSLMKFLRICSIAIGFLRLSCLLAWWRRKPDCSYRSTLSIRQDSMNC